MKTVDKAYTEIFSIALLWRMSITWRPLSLHVILAYIHSCHVVACAVSYEPQRDEYFAKIWRKSEIRAGGHVERLINHVDSVHCHALLLAFMGMRSRQVKIVSETRGTIKCQLRDIYLTNKLS